jgi:hypothetical protein
MDIAGPHRSKKMQNIITLQKLKYALLTIVLLELFLGGTGRLVEFTAFLTLRMCLFMLYMLLVIIYLFTRRTLPPEIVFIIGFFIIINILAIANGYFAGAAGADIFEDVKPLLNIFLLCYLSFTIKSTGDIRYMLKLLKISAVVLSVFHVIMYCIYLKFNDIDVLYSAINSAQSDNTVFLFKGESGFLNYTGDIYLCIGFIAWEQYHKTSALKYYMLILIMVAIVLTGTRGLIISLGLVYVVKWLLLKFDYKSLIYVAIGFGLLLAVFISLQGNIGDKDESDQTRYEQISQVAERITPVSAVIGHGYGIGVPVRPIHMEISYLEIFHKQGVIGLLYYTAILLIAYMAYKRCKRENALGFYMFILFIYFVSATNPYVNHPLGITAIAVALVSMLKLSKMQNITDTSLL